MAVARAADECAGRRGDIARQHAGHPRRSGQADHQPQHLRPFRRAPGPLHLRRVSGWARTARSPTRAASATTWSRRCGRSRCRCCAGRAGASPTSTTGRTASARARSGPTMVNTHWGGVTENNHFGTHEFIDLCEQLGCEPYICGNVGSGTVQEMQQWVEYITCDGISPMADLRRTNGREQPWKLPLLRRRQRELGLRRQHDAPSTTPTSIRRYATYVRNFGGNQVFKIACGPNGDDYHWTEVLMRECGQQHGRPGPALLLRLRARRASSATQFDEDDWFHQLRTRCGWRNSSRKHAAIMDQLRPAEEGRAGRGRMGGLARRRAGHQPRLPLPAEHASATPWSPASRSTSSTTTATACAWPTSPRRSTCSRR